MIAFPALVIDVKPELLNCVIIKFLFMFLREYVKLAADWAKTGSSVDYQWLVLDTTPSLKPLTFH